MDLVVPDYIVELSASARRAFDDLGGVDLAREAELDPAARARGGDALRALGADDIDPLADVDQALAAFTLCREAGRVAMPWPVDRPEKTSRRLVARCVSGKTSIAPLARIVGCTSSLSRCRVRTIP